MREKLSKPRLFGTEVLTDVGDSDAFGIGGTARRPFPTTPMSISQKPSRKNRPEAVCFGAVSVRSSHGHCSYWDTGTSRRRPEPAQASYSSYKFSFRFDGGVFCISLSTDLTGSMGVSYPENFSKKWPIRNKFVNGWANLDFFTDSSRNGHLFFIDHSSELPEGGAACLVVLVDTGVLQDGGEDLAGLLQDDVQGVLGGEGVLLLQLLDPLGMLL